MRGYYWTGQRIVWTDGGREEVCREVVGERRVAIGEKGNDTMMDIEGCEVGFGSGARKTERRDEVGRECTSVEVEGGTVWEIVSVGVGCWILRWCLY